MHIKNVTLSSFRAFKNPTTLNIGKRITAISGVNGVGKSTILAALVNGSHLKSNVKPGADVKIMDRLFWHREVPHSENFSKPGFQLKTA